MALLWKMDGTDSLQNPSLPDIPFCVLVSLSLRRASAERWRHRQRPGCETANPSPPGRGGTLARYQLLFGSGGALAVKSSLHGSAGVLAPGA